MDRNYIEANNIVARYLSGDLTVREAREFERFCAEHPEVSNNFPIPVRVKAKMQFKAAEAAASGEFDPTVQTGAFIRPQIESISSVAVDDEDEDDSDDEREPKSIARRIREASPVTLVLSLALMLMTVLTGVYWLRGNALRDELRETQLAAKSVSMRPPGTVREYRVALSSAQPSAPTMNIGYPDPPQLVELRVDMSKGRYNMFLVTIDSVQDGRVMQVRRVARDSNGEVRLSLNSSAFGRGDVDLQFAGYTWRGETVPVGWIRLGLN